MGEQKTYWNGLEDLHNDQVALKDRDDEFKEEFPLEGELSGESLAGVKSTRRDFLKIFGFGISAATLAACVETPVKKAIPYLIKPEDMTPGIAQWYASTCNGCGASCGVLVKTRDGRPIKLEGNEQSKISQGGSCAVGQSTVLSMYDSSRLRNPKKGSADATWADVDTALNGIVTSGGGGKVRILSNTVTSPTGRKAMQAFLGKFADGKHVTYEALSAYGIAKAHENQFNVKAVPGYNFDKAEVIVSFGADFLGTWLSPVEFTKQYVQKRKVDPADPKMSFHLQFESRMSLTGSNADLRIPVKPSEEGIALLSLYNKIANAKGAPAASVAAKEFAGNSIDLAAKQLLANEGKSLVVCGSNDVASQEVTAAINHLLGNYGQTLDYNKPSWQNMGDDEAVEALIKEMENKEVGVLILQHVNPVYDSALGARFTKALANVHTTIAITDHLDETASLCGWALPDNHFLESWGDSNPRHGVFSLQQPTIRSIFDTRQYQDSYLIWAGANTTYYDFLRKEWEETRFREQGRYLLFSEFWNATVQGGTFESEMTAPPVAMVEEDKKKDGKKPKGSKKDGGEEEAPEKVAMAGAGQWKGDVNSAATAIAGNKGGDMEVVLYPKVSLLDGRHANNPWLQEMPDPITKVTWENYVNVSYNDGMAKGLRDGDVVGVTLGGTTIELPVFLQPGQAAGTLAIALGYGRKSAGKVGDGIGSNVFPWVRQKDGSFQYWVSGAGLGTKIRSSELAKSQTYMGYELEAEGGPEKREMIETKRIAGDILKETTLARYKKNHTDGNRRPSNQNMLSLWHAHDRKGHHWAMAIDLNACTGCGACIVSCNAENNIPVVGKAEIRNRRDLHWMRIDRYFRGSPDAQDGTLEAMHQPLMCQHCNNAPCETVCPVLATTHSDEGLNQQVYNRCIGTRYCANNCPYKVRRFNWFSYYENSKFDYNMNDKWGKLQLNPDVTVRARGVMEKCSFCVQRIQAGKLKAKVEGRKPADGEIKTACQQTCPANAIVFGDLNDENSEILKLYKNERAYHAIEDVKTLPNVVYLTKVRNSLHKTETSAPEHKETNA